MARQAVLYFPIGASCTCEYEFTVRESAPLHAGSPNRTSAIPPDLCWTGRGSGGAYVGKAEGLVGPKPDFEICAGWLTLLPADGWTQSLPLALFSGQDSLATYDRMPQRDLKSFSVYIGEALARVMQAGDTLRVSRDQAGDFTYSLARKSQAILTAGSVESLDRGGAVAAWQEWDNRANPIFEKQKKLYHPGTRIAEFFQVAKPHVNVRILSQEFHLDVGQDAYLDPYYVFVARLHYAGGIGTVASRAIYASGRLSDIGRELIGDAAQLLIRPATRML